MKILVVCASPRQGSNSSKVANLIMQNLGQQSGVESKLFSFIGINFPSVGDHYLTKEELDPKQEELVDSIVWAERILWVIPEYNRDVPMEVTGFVDQFLTKSWPELWSNKIFGVAGVSSGIGGRDPIMYFWRVFNYAITKVGQNSWVSPYHFQSLFTGDQFDEQGNFKGTEVYASGLKTFVENFVK